MLCGAARPGGHDTLILLALLAIFLVVGYKVLDALKTR